MPTTVNGVGTHYYGHGNAIARQGHCSSCKRYATLTSYDTRLFVVVLFIPIIPLGKKRIVDSCSSCRRHFAVPLQTYIDGRNRDYAEADRLMSAARSDVEAIAAIRLVLQYREPATINRLIAAAEAKFPESPDLHAFIVEAHRFLSAFRAAEASAARSMALRDDPEIRETLAEFQFARDDVDAGRATLAPLLDRPAPQPSRAVEWGVEALQRKGRHREALELMNRVAIADAPPADAKRFAKLRATSERTLERAVVDPDRFESEGDGMIVRRKRQPYAKLRWAAAAAGLLAFAVRRDRRCGTARRSRARAVGP